MKEQVLGKARRIEIQGPRGEIGPPEGSFGRQCIFHRILSHSFLN